MKLTLAIAMALVAFSASKAKAEVLSLQGVTAVCNSITDVTGTNFGYSLDTPALSVANDTLVIDANLLLVGCQIDDQGNVGFMPIAANNSNDRLLVQDWKAIHINTYSTGLANHAAGLSETTVNAPLAKVLSSSERADFEAGKTINKKFYIYYGNYMSGDPAKMSNYQLSQGYYALTFGLSKTHVSVTSFQSE